MQTHFVRFGRRYKIPATIQIKDELRRMMHGGDAARAKPDVMTAPSDEPRNNASPARGVGEASLPIS